jgi:hypothetical protein
LAFRFPFLATEMRKDNDSNGGTAVKTEEKEKTMKYQPPRIRRVVLESKKRVLATCKVDKSDTRGLGPCQSEMGAVCKEP